jgi:manganese/iron transport system ATP-binding protein
MMEIRELSFGYTFGGGKITGEIKAGTLTFLAGANGSGKTTLLKTLAGLLKPQSGEVRARHKPLYLPAHPEVSDWLTAWDVFEIFSGRAEIQNRRDIEELEIQGILGKPLHQLSLGEQKRVFLAAALGSDSAILLLDEPLNSLDWNMEFALQRLLERHRAQGRALLVAAHQLQWVTRFADASLWFLHEFSRLKAGPVEEVLSSAEVQEIFNFRVAFTDNPLDGGRLIATSPAKGRHETT